ncbi:MAG: hypothetical protein SCM96_02255 [Acidobacteriota bacterium]|nr:hypothetical protein [Acidobacteriota bacterium]
MNASKNGFEVFLEFAKAEAARYGVDEISTRDPRVATTHPDWQEEESWKDGAYARVSQPLGAIRPRLHFNPNVDTAAAAEYLTKRLGCRIFPDEVYYFALFHEIGHMEVRGTPVALLLLSLDGKDLQAPIRESEKNADVWALQELFSWRRENSRAQAAGRQ